MVKPEIVAKKLTSARARLASADEVFARPLDEFRADEKQRDLASFYLFLAIQECIDIAAHWVADEGWGPPEDAAGAFEILHRKGVLEDDLASGLRGATGLRNRIAHGYTEVDPARLHAEYQKGVVILRRFLVVAANT